MSQIIVITGNLGRDPEMRYTPNGKAVTNFNVATNRKWTGADGTKNKETTWFRCTAWEGRAEVCNQYLHQGSKVLVRGHLVCDPATGGPKTFTRQDGTVSASFEIQVEEVEFLDSKDDNNGNGNGNGQVKFEKAQATIEDAPPW
jgi:single-strand DNA-binding protein